jgi:bacterioferritin-associated ferredoxin
MAPFSCSDGAFRTMYVCICNGVTDSDIRQAAKAGCGGLAELTMRTGCGACCGSCVDTAAEVLEQARAELKPGRDNVVAFPRISHAA